MILMNPQAFYSRSIIEQLPKELFPQLFEGAGGWLSLPSKLKCTPDWCRGKSNLLYSLFCRLGGFFWHLHWAPNPLNHLFRGAHDIPKKKSCESMVSAVSIRSSFSPHLHLQGCIWLRLPTGRGPALQSTRGNTFKQLSSQAWGLLTSPCDWSSRWIQSGFIALYCFSQVIKQSIPTIIRFNHTSRARLRLGYFKVSAQCKPWGTGMVDKMQCNDKKPNLTRNTN